MRAALALSSLALVALFFAPEFARAADEKPCPDQIEDLCPGSEPNTPERRACVKQNLDKLSESCRRMMGHVTAVQAGVPPAQPGASGLQNLVQACGKDHARMVELCQTSRPHGEDPLPCLGKHADQFSEPCREWIRAAEKAEAEKAKAVKTGAPPSGAALAKPPAATKAPGAAN